MLYILENFEVSSRYFGGGKRPTNRTTSYKTFIAFCPVRSGI